MRRIVVGLAILAAGLVVPACGGNSPLPVAASSSSAPATVTTLYSGAVILGAPGTARVQSRGGEGSATTGGSSGGIALHNQSGSEGKILRTGSIDTSFTVPSSPIALGSNPRTISADTELTVGGGLFAGQAFLLGDDGVTNATGLHVLPGFTLTLHPNVDLYNQDADNNQATGDKELVSLSFGQGILIEGAVVTTLWESSTANQADLNFFAEAGIIITDTGSISTRPADVTGGPGVWGGYITLTAAGAVINQGTLDASGGAGDTGGGSRGMTLQSTYWQVINTGTIRSSGGDGATGNGGIATGIQVYSSIYGVMGGGFFNSGPITSRGGNGSVNGGGGGFLYVSNGGADGPLFNSGAIDVSGGRSWVAGNGGTGGYVVLESIGGGVRFAGSVKTRGGNGAGAAGAGGAGGGIEIAANSSTTQPISSGCFVGADLDAGGGNGITGGASGLIAIWNNATYNNGGALQPWVRPGMAPLVLVGMLALDASGGDGNTVGGIAGAVTINNYATKDPGGTPHLLSFVNEADLEARGGNAGGGVAGAGGAITYGANATYASIITSETDRTLVNTGLVLAHGGNGVTGGAAGSFTMTDPFYVRNAGAVNMSGGSGSTGNGGAAGPIVFTSDGITINDADLSVNGGPSLTAFGGIGWQATVQGAQASHTGTVSARGGSGGTGTGGTGGRFRALSFNGITNSAISGFLDVRGGTGVTAAGVEGTINIDGVFRALVAGTLTF